MKRYHLFVIALCFVAVSCATLTQLTSFVNCKYELGSLSNPKISGISLNNITDVNSLDAMSLLRLSTGILAGSLPLTTTVNVKVVNPNPSAAQIEGLEWALDFNNSNILNGATNKPVSVPPNGGTAIIPLTVDLDLIGLTKGETKTEIFKMANSILNLGDASSQMSLRVRPTINVGGQPIRTGFITIRKNM